MSSLSCPFHPSAHLIEDTRAGDVICPECGLVVGDRLAIGQLRFENSADQQMKKGMKRVRDICENIHLVKVIQDRAAGFLRKMIDGKNFRGKSLDAQVAACIFVACRQEKVPRTIGEIIAVAGCSERKFKQCFKLFLQSTEKIAYMTSPEEYMGRFCGGLSLPYRVQHAATHVAQKAKELGLVEGRQPVSVAAAAIFIASQTSNSKRSAREVAEVTGSAESTVKLMYRLLAPQMHHLLPDRFVC